MGMERKTIGGFGILFIVFSIAILVSALITDPYVVNSRFLIQFFIGITSGLALLSYGFSKKRSNLFCLFSVTSFFVNFFHFSLKKIVLAKCYNILIN